MAVMAGWEASKGRMGPGDVTAAVLIMINLYAPLNILGFAYREIRQSAGLQIHPRREPGRGDGERAQCRCDGPLGGAAWRRRGHRWRGRLS